MPAVAFIGRVPAGMDWSWHERAACREHDPELFFHPAQSRGRKRRELEARAKKVCAGCDVRTECGDYALKAHEQFGVWGGLTELDRGFRPSGWKITDVEKAKRAHEERSAHESSQQA